MAELIHDKLKRWSLERVQFLLSHLEGFIDDEAKEFRAQALAFEPSALGDIKSLYQGDPSDPRVPIHVTMALSAFFEAGLLLQKSPSPESENWWGTDIFWRGHVFHLAAGDQVRADGLVPEMTPLQIHKASADKMLAQLKLPFLANDGHSDAYLLRPTPTVAYVLIAKIGAPWSADHLTQAQTLVNKCYIF